MSAFELAVVLVVLAAIGVGAVTLNGTGRDQTAPRPPVADDESAAEAIGESWQRAGWQLRRDWGRGVRAAHAEHVARFATDGREAGICEEDHRAVQ